MEEEGVGCEVCGKRFGAVEALHMHAKAKHSKPKEEKKQWEFVFSAVSKNIKKVAGALAVVAVPFFLFFSFSGNSEANVLPPTDIRDHVEEIPSSHVLKEPMPLLVQKHMLEHADGKGLPGIVINYNCLDFSCEPDLIPKLEAFASLSENVYVSPFPEMSVTIALTRYGRIETMDSFDEARIESFIFSG